MGYKKCLVTLLCSSFLILTQPALSSSDNVAQQKEDLQKKEELNPYLISLYEPTYIIPFSYTSSFNHAAESDTPDNAGLNNIEAKFQFSIRAAIWRNFFGYKNSLNLAYTQLSFWQVYNSKAQFFRESNYKPEIFFSNNLDKKLFHGWNLSFFNVGAIHQSNGRGGNHERSWDRIYIETIFSKDNWLFSIRPWYVIQDSALENNPHIANYLGHERLLLSYKFHNQTLSLLGYNFENPSRTSAQLTWSFPLVRQFRGYVQVFSGYGQSLIEYDHHTNSMSVGIALNDWL